MEIRPTYLLMITAENNNKYYNCFPEGDRFRVEYGRVDATKAITYYSMSKWDSQIAAKVKKGYKDVTDLKQDLVAEIKTKSPQFSHKEIESESVRQIVEKLQSLARETTAKNYKVASTAVTQQMVDAAQEVIDSLANGDNSVGDNSVKDNSVEAFNEKLLRLFTILPRKMYNVKDYLANDKEDFTRIITTEQSLLDVMRGQIYVKPVEEESEEQQKDITILDEFGLQMEEVNHDDIVLIKNLMNESADKFKRAWRVTNLHTQKRFDEFVKSNDIRDTKLLFHGSRSENFWCILKTGLSLRPANAIINGKMFGYGCYYATKCAKSIGYTSLSGSRWAKGNSDVGYMALFEVAYGKPYNVYNFDSKFYNMNYDNLQQLCPGANCLHAHTDRGMLVNDEIVVYNEDQMTIRYLIEIGR